MRRNLVVIVRLVRNCALGNLNIPRQQWMEAIGRGAGYQPRGYDVPSTREREAIHLSMREVTMGCWRN
jgi:hypothetical protein